MAFKAITTPANITAASFEEAVEGAFYAPVKFELDGVEREIDLVLRNSEPGNPFGADCAEAEFDSDEVHVLQRDYEFDAYECDELNAILSHVDRNICGTDFVSFAGRIHRADKDPVELQEGGITRYVQSTSKAHVQFKELVDGNFAVYVAERTGTVTLGRDVLIGSMELDLDGDLYAQAEEAFGIVQIA